MKPTGGRKERSEKDRIKPIKRDRYKLTFNQKQQTKLALSYIPKTKPKEIIDPTREAFLLEHYYPK